MGMLKRIMTRKVITIDREESCLAAAKKMAEHRIDCLVVAPKGVPVGIITMVDIIGDVVSQGKSPSKVRVEQVMSNAVQTVEVNASIFQVAFKMQYLKIKQLPVVHHGCLAGIVTQTDIVRSVNSILSKQVWIVIGLAAFSTFLSISLIWFMLQKG